MPLSKKDVKVILFLKVKDKPASLLKIRLSDSKDRAQRMLAFVPDDARKPTISDLLKHRLASMTYSMNFLNKTAHIGDVRTKENYQGLSLQQSLFTYAIKDMASKGIKLASLKWNGTKASLTLYTKMGFKITDKKTREMTLKVSKDTAKKIFVRDLNIEKKAIFPGKFDPFHLGHAYIIEMALELVDTILIYISKHGKNFAEVNARREMIKKYIRINGLSKRVQVYEGTKKSHQLAKEGYTVRIYGLDLFNSYRSNEARSRHTESLMEAKELILVMRPSKAIPRQQEEIEKIRSYCEKAGKIVHMIKLNTKTGVIYSSTNIRELISSNKSIHDLVPPEIEKDILRTYKPLLAD